jgi:hypothetical protein
VVFVIAQIVVAKHAHHVTLMISTVCLIHLATKLEPSSVHPVFKMDSSLRTLWTSMTRRHFLLNNLVW